MFGPDMNSIVYVERRRSVPEDATVFHYDELNEDFKHRFPELAENTPVEGLVGPENILSDGDYIKFTDYYRITYQ